MLSRSLLCGLLCALFASAPIAVAQADGEPRMAITVDGPRAATIARHLSRGVGDGVDVVATRTRYVGNSTEAWMLAERHDADLVFAGILEVEGRRTRMRVQVFGKDGAPLVSRTIALPRQRNAVRRVLERQARSLASRAIARARRLAAQPARAIAQATATAPRTRRVIAPAPSVAAPTSGRPTPRVVAVGSDPRG